VANARCYLLSILPGCNAEPMENLLYHLRFSIRLFRKDKFFSILNILGLALGITVSIILMLIVKSDFSYDKHYSKHERIFRLGAHYVIPDVDEMIGVTARELGPILKQTYPEIDELVRVHAWERALVKDPANQRTKSFYEERIAQVDSSYFKLFDHPFVAGDVSTCLNDPSNIVITKSTSRKYFGEAEALNKTLIVKDKPYQITAVIEDFPETTHLKFDILIAGLPEIRSSWDFTMKNGKGDRWMAGGICISRSHQHPSTWDDIDRITVICINSDRNSVSENSADESGEFVEV